ncbi:replication initiation protein [Aureibacter tunicatorum]|uniref:Plasmid replication initiation protein n=1 Tax=Aureibacter tunicatorum TaxID=866807 RepID=A0AAE3XSR9_9BACT|nr:replication initiation protein [Aureibacter tunicatorum]MDR6241912.1 plasmid replication initiation protein [Aureibacter tunicatorum]BDD07461.1 hypothetical protein AUTU_49440 [Aureibacter tunicatorum]
MALIHESYIRDYKIVKSNKFINSRQPNISLNAQRVLIFAMAMIKPEDHILKAIDVPIRLVLGKSADDKLQGYDYKKVREAAKELMDLKIEVEGDDGAWEEINFIQKSSGKAGVSYISIKFSDDVREFLLDLKDNYTSYVLNSVYNFKNPYSLRIYELCKQYLKIGKREISVDKLKFLLSIENKHNRWSNFKQNVIDKSCNEINEFSDILISFDEIKTGRKITGLVFYIERQKKPGVELMLNKEISSLDQHADALIASRTDIKNPEAYKAKLINSEDFKKDFERQQIEKESKIRKQALKQKEKEEKKQAKEKSELYNKYYLDVRKKYIEEFPDSFKAKYVEWVKENGNAEEKKSLQELIEKREKAPQRCWNLYGTFLIKNFGTEEDLKWLDIEQWWMDNQLNNTVEQSAF